MDAQLPAIIQGIYYLITGIWPILNITSFQKITGPKTDLWLVKTVGVLIGVQGIVFLFSARNEIIPPEIQMLAIGSAVALMSIDVTYVALKRIPKIYLLDAVGESVLIFLWLWASRRV